LPGDRRQLGCDLFTGAHADAKIREPSVVSETRHEFIEALRDYERQTLAALTVGIGDIDRVLAAVEDRYPDRGRRTSAV
jgi:hypothetical protein